MTKAQEVRFLLNHQGRSPSRKRVAGYRPRPMAIEAVKGRLLRAADARTRWLLAMNLAETCYECFNVENLFRELIDRDPVDLDGILTALVELDLAFKHIATHWRELEKPLEAAIHRVDLAYSKALKATESKRKAKRTAKRRTRRLQPGI